MSGRLQISNTLVTDVGRLGIRSMKRLMVLILLSFSIAKPGLFFLAHLKFPEFRKIRLHPVLSALLRIRLDE